MQRLAVITSPTGAAVRDVLSVLGRRFPLLEVDLLPTLVQGSSAAAQITRLLQAADASGRYDVILLTRGGGSLEDLWAFNDEALARAIAASRTPVVSAVGHETDFSLSDFAADLRAPTPSVAAELLVPDQRELALRLRRTAARMVQLQRHAMQQAMQRADRALLRLNAQSPQARLDLRAAASWIWAGACMPRSTSSRSAVPRACVTRLRYCVGIIRSASWTRCSVAWPPCVAAAGSPAAAAGT